MRLILLGPPGSGKGTQAHLLSQRFHLEHVATGDLLRAAIREGTPAGLRARPYVQKGDLVPDELVNDMVAEHFSTSAVQCFIMDGYPRNRAQAEAFDASLEKHNLGLTAVVHLLVDDEEILHRLGGRWSCPKTSCKATYHTEFNPPQVEGVCDRCGTVLLQREDDRPETVQARLQVYHRDMADLIPYYRKRNLLHEVQGTGEIEKVYANIVQALGPQANQPC